MLFCQIISAALWRLGEIVQRGEANQLFLCVIFNSRMQ